MDVQRIEGIKYDLDRLSDAELVGIRGHLLESHARLTGEVALLEFKLFQRSNTPLPIEEEERNMNSYAEVADIVLERTTEAQLGRTARWDDMGRY